MFMDFFFVMKIFAMTISSVLIDLETLSFNFVCVLIYEFIGNYGLSSLDELPVFK